MQVDVITNYSSWSEEIKERRDIGKIFTRNPDVKKVYLPPRSGDYEPEILTEWDIFKSVHDGECWRLTSILKPQFA